LIYSIPWPWQARIPCPSHYNTPYQLQGSRSYHSHRWAEDFGVSRTPPWSFWCGLSTHVDIYIYTDRWWSICLFNTYVCIYIKAEKHHVQVALIACRQYKLAYMNELPHTHTIWYIMGELGPLWTFSGVKLVGFITLLWNVYVSSSLQSPEAKTVPNINHTTLHVSHSL
jgi:hypothetical protein